MANQLLENLNKRSSEWTEKGTQVLTTAYQKSLDVLGLDEEEMRDRISTLKTRREQIESTVQQTLSDQLRELQSVEAKVVSRLEEAVGSLKDVVTGSYTRLSSSLDKLETRLKQFEDELAARTKALPIDGYDRLNADEIVRKIDIMPAESLKALRDYESQHKGRVTVLKAIDQRLAA